MIHPDDAKRIYNWQWRLQHLYKIRTKESKKIAFAFNPIQARIAKYLPHWHRFLILKARQMGVSTLFLLWHLDATMFTPNTTTAIIAHRRDSLKYLFRIIKMAYRECPDAIQKADGTVWKKPTASYDNANEIYFKEIDSTIYVALEVRSDTVHRCHVSEAHFIENAEDVLAATLSAVVPGGVVSMETTANGMGGTFYDLWQASVDGQNEYIPLFFGFHEHPDYRLAVDDPVAFKKTLDEKESTYLAIGVSLEALAWRRAKLKEPGMRAYFKQEFPATAEEAFLSTGKSPFDREKVEDWIIREPVESKMEGRLLYWIKPQKDHRYIIGVDCASGRGEERLQETEDGVESGTDYSVIQVWDCQTLELVSMFRAKWPYVRLHEIVLLLGREYNDAYIAIEATDHGLTVLTKLTETNYPHELIHTTEQLDLKSKKTVQKWGWYTNLKTKPLIIDHLAGLIDDELIRCYSRKAQSEFLRYTINDKGQYEAMEGYHDDTVMAAAIGLYLIPNALKSGRMTATKADLGLEMR